jgi:hypothetical protein
MPGPTKRKKLKTEGFFAWDDTDEKNGALKAYKTRD